MLNLISSIPTTVRAGLNVQDLPLRATQVSAEHLSEVKGGVCRFCCPFTPANCDNACKARGYKTGSCRGIGLATCQCSK